MKKTFIPLLIFAFILLPFVSMADGGMWLPMLLSQRQADMQSKGMKLTAEDIYSVNHSSLKDAVMLFGSGCTAEFVSAQGLILTNHHCGYGSIVSQSTVEKDYLTNGFWAMSKQEELPCPGMSITLLQYMQDVTQQVLQGVTNSISEKIRGEIIAQNIKKICSKVEKQSPNCKASVESCYYGNQYFLYVNKTFNDVRLVGAPPSNIGKFGGDTDNWMWPRHTGDFSMFRVYANKNNEPASYSKDNVPYTPKKFFSISLKGANDGDFTFVFGYPGSTTQFVNSDYVKLMQTEELPARVKIRNVRLDVYNQAMNQSPAQRLRYTNLVAGISNGWKKWMGEIKGLKRTNAITIKLKQEEEFNSWAQKSKARKQLYGSITEEFSKTYKEYIPLRMEKVYFSEAMLSSDLMNNAYTLLPIIKKAMKKNASQDSIQKEVDVINFRLQTYFSNAYSLHYKVDRDIFIRTMQIYYNDFAKQNYSWIKQKVDMSFGGKETDYFAYVYDNSFLANFDKCNKMLKHFKAKKVLKDPALELLSSIYGNVYGENSQNFDALNLKLDSLYRIYTKGLMEMDKKKVFYPDANLTLRVAYGKVEAYKPADGIDYNSHSTMAGIMEKENPEIYDYVVEGKLKALYEAEDFGPYADKNGKMSVAFTASNHTTGGNSGSPVIDANGNLIGINFDRNWEGTMSDIIYDSKMCRNISLDIRYCLFIIDKFADAHNLIEEMNIIK
jgi:Peptidase S46.